MKLILQSRVFRNRYNFMTTVGTAGVVEYHFILHDM